MARKPDSAQARFSSRYTEAQKDAILRSVLVDGRTVADTIRMANTGQLGLPAFTIGRYGYDIVRDHREAFEQSDDAALDRAIDTELKRAGAAALAHNRALLASFKRDGSGDPEALKRSAQALSGIKRARREATNGAARPKAKPDAPAIHDAPTNDAPGVAATLLKIADEAARSGSLKRSPKTAA